MILFFDILLQTAVFQHFTIFFEKFVIFFGFLKN